MANKQLPDEFREFLRYLNANKVDLVKSKVAAKRPKDLADLAELRRIKSRNSGY